MKVTVITGSAHRNGTTAILTEEFIKGAAEAGHQIYRFDAGMKNIHPCIACEKCHRTDTGCVFKDDMEELNPHLLEADVLVFVSPIYYYDINGQLKTVIDRFYANNEALMGNKKVVLMTTMADDTLKSAEGANVTFKNIAEFANWEIAGIINAKACWRAEDMQKTDYPKQAYDLGKSL